MADCVDATVSPKRRNWRGRQLLATGQAKYHTISISNVGADLHAALIAAAIKSYRSRSAEIHSRLERSFHDDEIIARLDRLEASIKALGACLVALVDEKRAA